MTEENKLLTDMLKNQAKSTQPPREPDVVKTADTGRRRMFIDRDLFAKSDKVRKEQVQAYVDPKVFKFITDISDKSRLSRSAVVEKILTAYVEQNAPHLLGSD